MNNIKLEVSLTSQGATIKVNGEQVLYSSFTGNIGVRDIIKPLLNEIETQLDSGKSDSDLEELKRNLRSIEFTF